MKRFSVILTAAFVAVLSFNACEEMGGLIPSGEFKFIKDWEEKIEDGQHFVMNPGDNFAIGIDDRGDRVGWLDEFEWSASDPSVVSIFNSYLVAQHGGESTVNLKAKDHEATISVSVPETPHGTIYFACHGDWDRNIDVISQLFDYNDKLFVNGKMNGDACNFLTSDAEGNIWQGVYENGAISLSNNGRELVKNLSFNYPMPELGYVRREFYRAKHGKLYLMSSVGSSFKYTIVSPDGSYTEGSVPDYNGFDIDEDGNGNIIVWGQDGHYGRNVLTIKPDGTIDSRPMEIPWRVIIDAGLDSDGNEYITCLYSLDVDAQSLEVYKNGQVYWRIKNRAWNPKMLIRGNDVCVALYAQEEEDDPTNIGLYIMKNKGYTQVATNLFGFSGLDFCLTPNGVPYTITNNDWGVVIYKDNTPVLCVPGIINYYNVMLAVSD